MSQKTGQQYCEIRIDWTHQDQLPFRHFAFALQFPGRAACGIGLWQPAPCKVQSSLRDAAHFSSSMDTDKLMMKLVP